MNTKRTAVTCNLMLPILLLSLFVWQLSVAQRAGAAYGFTPQYTYADPLDIDISTTGCTGTGWDIDRMELAYDLATDKLIVNYSTHNDVIFGDVDGDGDPATFSGCAGTGTDYADIGGPVGGEATDFIIDRDTDGVYDVIAGIKQGADISGITVTNYVGPAVPTSTPGFDYDSPVGVTAAVTNNPNTAQPDLQFEINTFAAGVMGVTPGDPFTFCFVARVGSFSDGRIGEDVTPSVGCHPFEYPPVDRDYGDLPDAYGTMFSADGARHILTGAQWLGTSVDADGNGQPNATATGDDIDVATDDEDGVQTSGGTWTDGSESLSVNVTGAGCLLGWIDWSGDGDFTDSAVGGVPELVINQYIAASGLIPITTPTLQDYLDSGATEYPASLYARFRLFPPNDPLFGILPMDANGCPTSASMAQVAALVTGEAGGGEVEDYRWDDFTDPTAVSLQGIGIEASTDSALGLLLAVGLLAGLSALAVLRRRAQRTA